MRRYIKKLEEGRDLSSEEAEAAVSKILSTAEDDEIGAFLLALKAKGEKPEEIAGFVRGMRKAANTIRPRVAFQACGYLRDRGRWPQYNQCFDSSSNRDCCSRRSCSQTRKQGCNLNVRKLGCA